MKPRCNPSEWDFLSTVISAWITWAVPHLFVAVRDKTVPRDIPIRTSSLITVSQKNDITVYIHSTFSDPFFAFPRLLIAACRAFNGSLAFCFLHIVGSRYHAPYLIFSNFIWEGTCKNTATVFFHHVGICSSCDRQYRHCPRTWIPPLKGLPGMTLYLQL